MDQPYPIDSVHIELAAKVVMSALSNQPAGVTAINNPEMAVALLRALAIEVATLRRGEYELPQKK